MSEPQAGHPAVHTKVCHSETSENQTREILECSRAHQTLGTEGDGTIIFERKDQAES
jgi:hypothetical protein